MIFKRVRVFFCAGAAHNFERTDRNTRLRYREHVNIVHEFLHNRQLPD